MSYPLGPFFLACLACLAWGGASGLGRHCVVSSLATDILARPATCRSVSIGSCFVCAGLRMQAAWSDCSVVQSQAQLQLVVG